MNNPERLDEWVYRVNKREYFYHRMALKKKKKSKREMETYNINIGHRIILLS